LDAPLELEQLDLHVNSVGKLGVRFTNRSEFYDFTGFGTRGSRGTRRVGHQKIIPVVRLKAASIEDLRA
jgi:hypothetical protein